MSHTGDLNNEAHDVARGTRPWRTILLCAGLLLGLMTPTTLAAPATSSSRAAPAAALTQAVPPTVPTSAFRLPLDGQLRVARPFDPPSQPWLPGHRGVDLAATAKATVRAAGSGVVRFAGPLAGRPVISIDHANGLRTTYEPVEPMVKAGDRVSAGDPIGRLVAGHGGGTASACLHWGLRRGDVYLDPLILLGLGQVRLLPLVERQPGAE